MSIELVNLKVAIRLLKEAADKVDQENKPDISQRIWLTIHFIWIEIVKITNQNEKSGFESRENVITSAIKAERKDLAGHFLAKLVLEKNIDKNQFYSLKQIVEK